MAWLRRRWPLLALLAITAFLIGFTLQLGVELESDRAVTEASR